MAASGEINVHISVQQETTPWLEVSERLTSEGVAGIVSAVNRKRTEVVYEPVTTGVEKARYKCRPSSRGYVLPAKRHFFGVGDAGFEPATSAV